MEPAGVWVDRMDRSQWGDLIPHYIPRTPTGRTRGTSAGSAAPRAPRSSDARPASTPRSCSPAPWKYTEGHAGAWDPAARVQTLDEEGIDATVLYPSLALDVRPARPDPRRARSGVRRRLHRAYNDWIAEYCSFAPDRLFAAAAVPLQDIDPPSTEAQPRGRRARPEGRLHPLRRSYFDGRAVQPPALRPVLGRVPGARRADRRCTRRPTPTCPTRPAKFGLVRQSADMAVANKVADEVTGGTALEHRRRRARRRDPHARPPAHGRRVRAVPRPQVPRSSSPAADGPRRCSSAWTRRSRPTRRRRAGSRCKPSEYFRRQCWISFEPDDPTLPRLADLIGVDRILWASDFPHSDAIYPGTVKALEDTIAPLTDDVKDLVRGANAFEAYGLKTDWLG